MIGKNLIFLGAPGSGKGTVAAALIKKIDITHISTGNIFRNEIQNKTKLGLELKELVESGAYVPDTITNQIIANELETLNSQQKSYILDGYPRTINQAEFLDTLNYVNIDAVILLDVPLDVIVERLSKRRSCPTCKAIYHVDNSPSKKGELCENDNTLLIIRKDDQKEAVTKRLEIYETQTKPLIEYYQRQNKLIKLNGNTKVEITIEEILEKVFS